MRISDWSSACALPISGHTVYDWRHYLAVVQRKPGALRNGAPFLELPEDFQRLQRHLLRNPGGDREMVEILALVLHHDEEAVLTAVAMALDAGVPTKTHILNRSEEHTSELQSLMRISYAVFCLKKKKT